MTDQERSARTRVADELCAAAFTEALGGAPDPGPARSLARQGDFRIAAAPPDRTAEPASPSRSARPAGQGVISDPERAPNRAHRPDEQGLALVAVGGYGRRELAPFSDLDVVLIHADDRDVTDIAARVWYRLWDRTPRLDHAVRAESEVAGSASADLRVALGLLDIRHLAGDAALTRRVRSAVLAQWRRDARADLPGLKQLVRLREERLPELGHASVPDLKESVGGLRDAVILKALVMTWLVDVPHAELESSRRALLDVRDVLQRAAGRATDRIAPELWAPLAQGLGLADPESAQRHVRSIARRLTHLARLTWHRVDALLARPAGVRARRPHLDRVAPGVAVSAGEIVLDRGADASQDVLLLLRAATEAAERSMMLAPPTVARLVRAAPAIPEPWPAQARQLLTRFLAAGPGLLAVWETLEETGGLTMILPEFTAVLLLPHASPLHRFTVDRHLVETCIEASRLIRRVSRPDLLMVAAILHDVGKASQHDHSLAGVPVARAAATRMGFSAADVDVVASLVRWHLLLAQIATTRDLEDPATAQYVIDRVPDQDTLDLLEVLTQADARAASHQAWTGWRAALVTDLCRRVRGLQRDPRGVQPAQHEPIPIPPTARDGHVWVEVASEDDSARVRVIGPDQIGLLAAIAGAFALSRSSVRAARAWTQDQYAVSVWEVDDPFLEPAVFRNRLDAVLTGTVDPSDRLTRRAGPEPAVEIRHDASRDATVMEVRTDDLPGVLYLVTRTLAALAITVRSTHVATLGPQTLDVFYLQEPAAGALADDRAALAAHAVRAALA